MKDPNENQKKLQPRTDSVDDLHDLFASTAGPDGKDEEDPLAHLRNDPNYSALIRDLEYIAAQARLLFAPAEEDGPTRDLLPDILKQLPGKPDEV